MGYLGLSEAIEKQDNLFQRIFWPGNGAADVDALGQRGFWLCAVLGTVLGAALTIQEHWLLGLLTLTFYWIGGIGVREHSTVAAVLITVAYLLSCSSGLMLGHLPGAANLFAAVLLISNIRATYIAANLTSAGQLQDFPERLGTTWRDRLVDQMPAQVWPRMRVTFFVIAGVYMLLMVAGTAALAMRMHHTTL